MRLSNYFLPLLKEDPQDAQVISHRLMLRAGMISQLSSGIYTWLPFGLKVLQKISDIVREEHDKNDCQEVLMSITQPADLWIESGRYEAYGKEMLRFQDRHEREMLFGPTNEEVITDVVRRYVKSYRSLPLCLYQIQWKFRDEIRPRFGVMRGREFLMKDAYSFDLDEASAIARYKTMMNIYLSIFRRLQLKAMPVRAVTGAIGGDLSHEFHILAETGESQIYYDKSFFEQETMDAENLMNIYTAADEQYDPAQCPVPESQLGTARGIEIGHVFNFGTKYSRALNATVMGPEGQPVYPEMGSYGIGVSRLVAAIIESSHDEHGIIWPKTVAPFQVGLIALKAKDPTVQAACESFYAKLQAMKIDVLYDDRDESPGVKFSTIDLLGMPWQIVIGPKGVQNNEVEFKDRATGEKKTLSFDAALNLLQVQHEAH